MRRIQMSKKKERKNNNYTISWEKTLYVKYII